MVNYLVAHNAFTCVRAMLGHIMAKISQAYMPAGYQNFSYTFHSVANLPIKLVLGPYRAGMLAGVVGMAVQFSFLHMF